MPAVTRVATAEQRQRRERGPINPNDIVTGAFDVYAAVSVHVRGSVVLHRLRDKATAKDRASVNELRSSPPETTPLLAQALRDGHKLRPVDGGNLDLGLECILDHAERLIAANTQQARARRRPRS